MMHMQLLLEKLWNLVEHDLDSEVRSLALKVLRYLRTVP